MAVAPFKSERIKEAILRAAKAAGVDDADYCATVAEKSLAANERAQSGGWLTRSKSRLKNHVRPVQQLARALISNNVDLNEVCGRLNQKFAARRAKPTRVAQ